MWWKLPQKPFGQFIEFDTHPTWAAEQPPVAFSESRQGRRAAPNTSRQQRTGTGTRKPYWGTLRYGAPGSFRVAF